MNGPNINKSVTWQMVKLVLFKLNKLVIREPIISNDLTDLLIVVLIQTSQKRSQVAKMIKPDIVKIDDILDMSVSPTAFSQRRVGG